ncbi:MAG: hypothetical protein WCT54_00895 [Patescibacteria group bacterium]
MKGRQNKFKALFIQSIATGALKRDFLTHLWTEVLQTEPLIETVRMSDIDLVVLGTPPLFANLMIEPPEEANGHIDILVDDIKAAVEWLTEQGAPFTLSNDAQYLQFDPRYFDEDTRLSVRLTQAPEYTLSFIGETPDSQSLAGDDKPGLTAH